MGHVRHHPISICPTLSSSPSTPRNSPLLHPSACFHFCRDAVCYAPNSGNVNLALLLDTSIVNVNHSICIMAEPAALLFFSCRCLIDNRIRTHGNPVTSHPIFVHGPRHHSCNQHSYQQRSRELGNE